MIFRYVSFHSLTLLDLTTESYAFSFLMSAIFSCTQPVSMELQSGVNRPRLKSWPKNVLFVKDGMQFRGLLSQKNSSSFFALDRSGYPRQIRLRILESIPPVFHKEWPPSSVCFQAYKWCWIKWNCVWLLQFWCWAKNLNFLPAADRNSKLKLRLQPPPYLGGYMSDVEMQGILVWQVIPFLPF